MTDENSTKPDAPQAKKVEVNHGMPHPEADGLVRSLYQLIQGNLTNPKAVLEWLVQRPGDIVRIALMRSQTAPWSLASEPLVASLTDEQARGVLACIVVGIYQGRMTR